MADNVTITNGATNWDADTNSDWTAASDDVSGVQFQKVKIDLGGDGVSSPLTAGQQAKSGSLPVTLASDEDTLSVDASSAVSSATESTHGVTTSSTEVIASNSSRKGGFLQNNSDEDVFISFGNTATSSHTKLYKNGGTLSLVLDGVNVFTGAVNAIHAGSGTKTILYVEV